MFTYFTTYCANFVYLPIDESNAACIGYSKILKILSTYLTLFYFFIMWLFSALLNVVVLCEFFLLYIPFN
jgi:hypothetical protein